MDGEISKTIQLEKEQSVSDVELLDASEIEVQGIQFMSMCNLKSYLRHFSDEIILNHYFHLITRI